MSVNKGTPLRGTRDTSHDSAFAKPRDIGEKIWMYERNETPLLSWAMRNGKKSKPVYNHIFSHNEKSPHSNWVTFAGVAESSQLTTGIILAAGQGARVTLGSRIFWVRNEEIMRLSAVMSTDTTGAVSRNFGRGTASTDLLKPGDKGLLLTPAMEQGYTPGLGLSKGLVNIQFATGILDMVVEVTGTEDTEKQFSGESPFDEATADTMSLSKKMMEADYLFGGLETDNTGTHPLTTSQGLDTFIQTNVYTASTLSRQDLWDILLEVKSYNKSGITIACSTAFKSMITNWALSKTYYDQSTNKDGLEITRVLTPVGEFELLEIDVFGDEANLMGTVFFMPSNQHRYRPLVHNGNRDIKFQMINKRDATGQDVIAGHLWGEYGWEFYHEEVWAVLKGLDFAA